MLTVFLPEGPNNFSIFNFNLFCVYLIHRGYDPSDMERVNTENNVTNIIHDVRYNTINFRIQLSRRHSNRETSVESVHHMAFTPKAVLSISCLTDSVSLSLKYSLMQMQFFLLVSH
jgi:hypothetical protein